MLSQSASARERLLSLPEGCWALAFAVLGRVLRPVAEPWSSPGGQRVLVIAPHPDDDLAAAPGTMLLHRRRGDEVRVLYVTDGRGSRALGLGSEAMAAKRRAEAEAGLQALGLDSFEWLGLAESGWRLDQLRPRLAALLGRYAPQIVYAPSRVDFHPEHCKVAHALGRVAQDFRDARPAAIRICQVQVPLTPVLTNLVAATEGVRAEIQAALAAHRTQAASLACSVRARRYPGRLYGVDGPVEPFWQLSLEQYALLHRGDPATWPRGAFRGLRYRSLSDPLAYLCGLGERRRLAAIVRGGW